MTAVGVEVGGSWFPTSGVVGFFIVLLLLSIFLTALCSQCSRRSFELRDCEADRDPSALIKVATLEEAVEVRDNPAINESLRDELDLNPSKGTTVSFTPWRSHLGAPQHHHDDQTNGITALKNTAKSNPEEENSVPFPLWRSHLNQDLNSSNAPENIYHTIGGGGSSNDADVASPLTNHKPVKEPRDSVYAQISKKERPTALPVRPPEEVLVEEDVFSPPLPDRKTQLEG
ncbi:uncharacterized protein [Cebidichthys violaceus]|uniref:uncharacterized protein isoform X2 n=1 Tax=Cebidichthys violaceus TaxID=271503 RepID=UPI0035CC08C4